VADVMLQSICIIVYKYHISLDDALQLTIPQISILENNLARFCRAEAGEKEPMSEVSPETRDKYNALYGDIIKKLRAETGRNAFTFKEILNPGETIKKYKKA